MVNGHQLSEVEFKQLKRPGKYKGVCMRSGHFGVEIFDRRTKNKVLAGNISHCRWGLQSLPGGTRDHGPLTEASLGEPSALRKYHGRSCNHISHRSWGLQTLPWGRQNHGRFTEASLGEPSAFRKYEWCSCNLFDTLWLPSLDNMFDVILGGRYFTFIDNIEGFPFYWVYDFSHVNNLWFLLMETLFYMGLSLT